MLMDWYATVKHRGFTEVQDLSLAMLGDGTAQNKLKTKSSFLAYKTKRKEMMRNKRKMKQMTRKRKMTKKTMLLRCQMILREPWKMRHKMMKMTMT